jgi:uncharacterized protein YecT (DUF1311 family)
MAFPLTVAALLLLTTSATPADLCLPGNQYEIRVCMAHEVEKSDRELNLAYRKLRKAIADSAMPEAGPGEISPKDLEAALVKSQRSWLAFRDAECHYDAELGRGGTGTLSGLAYNKCIAELNYARAATFRARLWEWMDL